MELILLRHGAAPGNLLHQYLGRTDEPLAEEGIRQAKALAGLLPQPELLFVSPMKRCTMTAALVWPGIEQQIVPDLREADFGRFEGKTWEELKTDRGYLAWINGTADCPGGETRTEVSVRIRRAGAKCFSQALSMHCRTAAITAHGGTIMELLAQSFGGSLYDWQPPLCGGWCVAVLPDGSLSDPKRIGVQGCGV